MDIPLFILFLAGSALVLLILAFIIAMIKLSKTRKELIKVLKIVSDKNKDISTIEDAKAKLTIDLAKVTHRKERYKKISLDLANEMILLEGDKADLRLQVEQLRNQKLRGWDIPDDMGPQD